MHPILSKLLQKRGIDNINELSQEEQKSFNGWKAILSKEELSTKDIKEFCSTQAGLIESKWADLNIPSERKAELIPYFTIYKLLLQAIDSPKVAREAIEKQLMELIK